MKRLSQWWDSVGSSNSPTNMTSPPLSSPPNFVSSSPSESGSQKKDKKKFSMNRLKQLNSQLQKSFPIVLAGNGATASREKRGQHESALIENLRQLAEILIWSDQNDDSLFHYFFEEEMLKIFLLQYPQRHVQIQALQTLSILVQNTGNETSLYYLLSQNNINEFIGMHGFDFEDEEVLAHYVTFLKILSFKLNTRTLQFFFFPNDSRFPLYTEAIRFFRHEEAMIRASVRTIALNVFRVCEFSNPAMDFVLRKEENPYLRKLVSVLMGSCENVDKIAKAWGYAVESPLHSTRVGMRHHTSSFGLPEYGKLTGRISSQVFDDMYYLGDILSLRLAPLSAALHSHLVTEFINVLITKPFDCGWTLFLLSQCGLLGERDPEFLQTLANSALEEKSPLVTNVFGKRISSILLHEDDRVVSTSLAFFGALVELHHQIDPHVLDRVGLLPSSLLRQRSLVAQLLVEADGTSSLSAPTSPTAAEAGNRVFPDNSEGGKRNSDMAFKNTTVLSRKHSKSDAADLADHCPSEEKATSSNGEDGRHEGRPEEDTSQGSQDVREPLETNITVTLYAAYSLPIRIRLFAVPETSRIRTFLPIHRPVSEADFAEALLMVIDSPSSKRRVVTVHLACRLLSMLYSVSDPSSITSELSSSIPSAYPQTFALSDSIWLSFPQAKDRLLNLFLRLRKRAFAFFNDPDQMFYEFFITRIDTLFSKLKQIESMRWERFLSDPSLCFAPFDWTEANVLQCATFREAVEPWRRLPMTPVEVMVADLHKFLALRSLLPRVSCPDSKRNDWRDGELLFPRATRPYRTRQKVSMSAPVDSMSPCWLRAEIRAPDGPAPPIMWSEYAYRHDATIFFANSFCYVAHPSIDGSETLEVDMSFPILWGRVVRCEVPYTFALVVPYFHISGDPPANPKIEASVSSVSPTMPSAAQNPIQPSSSNSNSSSGSSSGSGSGSGSGTNSASGSFSGAPGGGSASGSAVSSPPLVGLPLADHQQPPRTPAQQAMCVQAPPSPKDDVILYVRFTVPEMFEVVQERIALEIQKARQVRRLQLLQLLQDDSPITHLL
eukprot:ANDGO_06325.mRNA.1 Protein CLEC16A homolog